MPSLKLASHLTKTIGVLVALYGRSQNQWGPVGIGVILLVVSWYMLDFHYVRKRQLLVLTKEE